MTHSEPGKKLNFEMNMYASLMTSGLIPRFYKQTNKNNHKPENQTELKVKKHEKVHRAKCPRILVII